jgi:hypothetical protein
MWCCLQLPASNQVHMQQPDAVRIGLIFPPYAVQAVSFAAIKEPTLWTRRVTHAMTPVLCSIMTGYKPLFARWTPASIAATHSCPWTRMWVCAKSMLPHTDSKCDLELNILTPDDTHNRNVHALTTPPSVDTCLMTDPSACKSAKRVHLAVSYWPLPGSRH